MSKFRISVNQNDVNNLLRSDEVLKICKEFADGAQAKLGDGYEVTTWVGPNRCNASVAAVTWKAINENRKENTVLKALR